MSLKQGKLDRPIAQAVYLKWIACNRISRLPGKIKHLPVPLCDMRRIICAGTKRGIEHLNVRTLNIERGSIRRLHHAIPLAKTVQRCNPLIQPRILSKIMKNRKLCKSLGMLFNQSELQARDAKLQHDRRLGDIRVAADQMETVNGASFTLMTFFSGIDQRPVIRASTRRIRHFRKPLHARSEPEHTTFRVAPAIAGIENLRCEMCRQC